MDVLTLSRIQFGDTAIFHILWPLMSIGLSLFMFVMECLWLKTKDEKYYRQLRFWMKIFVLTFAIGVATGFPLSFQFGTNWAAFATAAGSFFGNILGFETTIAFTLETASLGLLLFGWNKVPKLVHLGANFLVLTGASLSAFWIVAANSWMQVPQGVVIEAGKVVVKDYGAAIFNPATLVSFAHMWIACIVSTLFLIAGISACVLLSKKATDAAKAFFLDSFRYAIIIAIILTPVQMVVGDALGLVVSHYQPAKLAAIELHWDTNAPGTSADWALVALPSADGHSNSFQVVVPHMLSLIITHTPTGQVQGLNDFAPNDRPTAVDDILVFYAFRIMAGIGVLMFALALWGAWMLTRRKLHLPEITNHKWFLRAWALALPLGFIATETGWMVREIGRQPWIVYGLMRTKDALSSHLESPVIGTTIIALTLVYAALAFGFVYFVIRIVRKGPDVDSKQIIL